MTIGLYNKGVNKMLNKLESGNKIYRYCNNLINVGWFSGYIFNLSKDRKSFFLRQSSYASHLFFVEMAQNDFLPSIFKEGSGIKIMARLVPSEVAGMKSIKLTPVYADRAPKSQLPDIEDQPETPPQDKKFDPYFAYNLTPIAGTAVNTVLLAGFIDTLIHDTNENGEIKGDCLLMDLRTGPKDVLPIRIYGNRAKSEFNTIKRTPNKGKFQPVSFNTQLRSKIIKVEDPEQGEVNQIISYVHSSVITTMDPEDCADYFLGHPDWFLEVQKNWLDQQAEIQN